MSDVKKIFRVFVASPGDLADERDAVEEIINDVNSLVGDALNARLELVRWEKNARPALGVDAQDVINKQIGDNYDIFVGLMWGRFGSPTHRADSGTADSGTEEEFYRALARWKENPQSVEIMFYFKDVGIPLSQMDPQQLAKVLEFRNRYISEHGGLPWPLQDIDDFKSNLRMHLSAVLREKIASSDTKSAPTTAPTIPSAVLKHFSSLTDDDFDDGIIELAERSDDAMVALLPTMDRIAKATTTLGDNMRSRTSDIEAAQMPGTPVSREDAKRIANASADDIEKFVGELAAVVPEYQLKQTQAFDLFRKVVVISSADFKESSEDVERVLGSVQGLSKNMDISRSQIHAFRDSMASLPRMTSAFNRSRRRAVALLDDLIGEMQAGLASAGDIERLLLQRLGKMGDQK